MKKKLGFNKRKKNRRLVPITIFILISILILTTSQNSYSESSRNTDSYNHFHLSYSQNVSGNIFEIKISRDLSKLAIKTTNIGVLLQTSNFAILCNFSTFARKGFDWNLNSSEFADGKFIRNSNNCKARDILYGDSISWNKDNHIATIVYPLLSIWNSNDLTLIYRQSGKNFTAVAWNLNGSKLAATQYSKVNILNIINYSINKTFFMEKDESTSNTPIIKWSPDSKYIAYSSGEFFIQLINVGNSTIYKKLYGFTSHVTSFDWSSDGNYIVAGSSDKTVNIYDLKNDTIYTLHLKNKIAVGICFVQNYHDIIIGTSIGTIEDWKFDKDILKADAGPDLSGFLDQTLNLVGDGTVGEIPDNGYTWTISDSNGPIATLTGRDAAYIFSQIGTFSIKLTVKDIHGSISEDSAIAHISYSTNKPIVKINYPTNNSVLSNTTYLKGTVNGIVQRVEIQVNGGGWQIADGKINWQLKFDSTIYNDGAYVLYVRALDAVQSSDIVHVLFKIDNSKSIPSNDPPPTIKILQPIDNSVVNGTILIKGIADDNTYISEISIELPGVQLDAEGGKNWFLYFNTLEVPDGKWTIRADAYDEFRQISYATVTIFINNTGIGPNAPPLIGITFPSNNSKISGIINFTGWASDDHELKIIQIRMNESLWHTCSGYQNWKYLYNSSLVNNGPLIIRARAFDGHLFSVNATIIVNVANPSNNTHDNNPPDTRNDQTYIISYIFIVLLLLIIIFLSYIAFLAKKLRAILSIIIIVLMISIIVLWPTNSLIQQKNPNSTINNGPPPSNSINNTSYAPDFTFMSLKDGKIITNEKELGRVVFLYFTWEYGLEANFQILKNLNAYYNTNGTIKLHILVLLYNPYVSDKTFNTTMKYGDPSWDYQQDSLHIRTNFNQPYAGKGWVIINGKESVVYNDFETGFSLSHFKEIIDPLVIQ
jgi:WD40 repeat protein